MAERRQGNHHKKRKSYPDNFQRLSRQCAAVITTVVNTCTGPQKESSLRLYRAVNSYTAAAQPQEEFFLGLYRALNGYTAAVQPQEESSLRLCRAVNSYTAAAQPQEEFFLGLYRALNGYTAAVQPQEESSLRLCRAVYTAIQRLNSGCTATRRILFMAVYGAVRKMPSTIN